MRIAQVAPLWARLPPQDYGGTELRVHWLTQALLERGHEVTLYASGDSETDAVLKSVCAQNLLDLMRNDRAHNYDHYTNAALADALGDSASYDILHCHTEVAHIPFAVLSRAPVVFSLRTYLSMDDLWLVQRYPRIAFVAMSRSQIRELPDDLRRSTPVIYNGCDFSAYEFSVRPGRYLLFLGRMGRHKNPVGAIEVAKAAGWPIVLAGKPQDRSERAHFEENVKPLIDGTNVVYAGPADQQQKRVLLRDAAALLFPIQWEEPFGNVMIEAMAAGTPVLATRRGSVPEVVDNGVTGFSAESADELPALVAQAVTLDRRLVREHAKRRFSHDRMAADYVELYRSLIERR